MIKGNQYSRSSDGLDSDGVLHDVRFVGMFIVRRGGVHGAVRLRKHFSRSTCIAINGGSAVWVTVELKHCWRSSSGIPTLLCCQDDCPVRPVERRYDDNDMLDRSKRIRGFRHSFFQILVDSHHRLTIREQGAEEWHKEHSVIARLFIPIRVCSEAQRVNAVVLLLLRVEEDHNRQRGKIRQWL